MISTKGKIVSICFCVSMAALGCKSTVPDSELVAKVNSEGITKLDFEKQVERNMARYKGQGHTLPPGIEQRIKQSVLRRMIDDKVIEQKAKTIKITVAPTELDEKFKEHKNRFRTEQAFQDYLKRSNNTEENMKADLRRNLLRDRVVENLSGQIDIKDEEINKYYQDNLRRFIEKEQIKASRILFRVPPNASKKDLKKAEKEAKKIYTKAKSKKADFGELAKEHSKGPEASRRGELNWMTRGRMPPEFDNVAFNLKKDEVSKVFKTKLGFEIVKVWEKKPERQRPFDEVKENIKNSLSARKKNEKRREVLRNLKKDAKVEQLVKFEPPPRMPPRGVPGAPGNPPPGTPNVPKAPGSGKGAALQPKPNQPPPSAIPSKPTKAEAKTQ